MSKLTFISVPNISINLSSNHMWLNVSVSKDKVCVVNSLYAKLKKISLLNKNDIQVI